MKKILVVIFAVSLIALAAFAIPVKKETTQEILKTETPQIVDQSLVSNDQLFDFDAEAQ